MENTHLFFLLKFDHDSTIFFSPLLLAYTFNVLNHIHQYNQPNTIRYLLYVIYYALYTMYYALCIIYYTLFTIHYSLFTIHYSLCTMHTHLYIFIRIYCFIRIHTYSLFHMEIRNKKINESFKKKQKKKKKKRKEKL